MILYDITVLEYFLFFHHNHVTVIVSCDCDVMLDPTSRSPRIENKAKRKKNKSEKKLNKVHYS